MKNPLPAILLLLTALAAEGSPAFWVWNRGSGLSDSEKRELQASGVTTLYWHFAEIENRDGKWRWKKAPQPLPEKSSPSLRIVPVIRLESTAKDPFGADARNGLRQLLVAAFGPLGADEWQLDYDSPDRLIGDYAAFLSELRLSAPKLSATALAGWVRLSSFSTLCGSVAELCPMFYDLEPDTASALRPLIDPMGTPELMEDWRKRCTVPWKAGLPWFARLTIYGIDGNSRGHLRQWSWDDVVFRREFTLVPGTAGGITAFRAEKPLTLGQTPLRQGETLIARRPDVATLLEMEKLAGSDVIYFRLPDAAASSGGSLAAFMCRGESGKASATLSMSGGRLVLTNSGAADLPARAVGDGPLDRGYAVEIDSSGPVFREAEPGGFFRIAGHRAPDSPNPERVRTPAATRLTLWFSALPAGSSLESGVFQLAPAATAADLRYRILNLQENPPWTPIATSP